jgi:hypothetical protein
MKAFLPFISTLALVCTCSLAHAQQAITQEEGQLPKKGKRLESRGMESGVFMQEGKMMTMKDGTAQPMAGPMTMNNGTKVMTDGSVMMADGKTLMLHNGQYMRLDGSIMDHGAMKGKGTSKRSL